MAFVLKYTPEGGANLEVLRANAESARAAREARGQVKSSQAEGRFKQVAKALMLLADNPRHPGLQAHEFDSLTNPFDPKEKVWEAYAQNNTPGAYRIFWCYGPGQGEITVLAITPHP